MGTAFAAAARTLFADPNGSVAGVLAVSGGAAVAVRVLFSHHDEDVLQFDGPGARNPGWRAELLAAALTQPPRVGLDTLTVGGTTYTIRKVDQQNDPDGITWMLDLGRAA